MVLKNQDIASMDEKIQSASSTYEDPNDKSTLIILGTYSKRLDALDNRVVILEKAKKPEEEYFEEAKKFNKRSMLIFYLLPPVQIAVTILCMYKIVKDDFVKILLGVGLGFVAIGTIFQIIANYNKVIDIENRLKVIEDNLKK